MKGKRKHIEKANTKDIAYPNQHIDIEISHGSKDHVIVPDNVKITFDLDIELKEKARSVVNNVGRALVKKKILMIGSKEIDTIDNSDIYDTYKDLYLSEKEREKKILQGMQPAKGSKVWVGAKKADGTALTVITLEMPSKRRLIKSLQYR